MHFDKVGFIGLGLIGGSIARKMKENNPKVSIIATAGHQQTIDDALSLIHIYSQKQMTLMVHYISLMNSMRMIDCALSLIHICSKLANFEVESDYGNA